MSKLFLIPVILFVAAHCLCAAPDRLRIGAETTDLEDRVDQRDKEIATMTAYSARLEQILDRAGVPHPDSAGKLSLDQKMDRVFPSVHCDGAGFFDVMTTLSHAVNLDIRVDWKILEGAGIDKAAPITCDLRFASTRVALRAILDSAGGGSEKLTCLLEDGVVKVTTAEQAAGHVLTKTYDATFFLSHRQNLAEAQEVLARLVMDTVAPDTWRDAGGTTGSLSFARFQMTVTQTQANHDALENLLEQLDENRGNAHRRATIEQQGIEIAALTTQIDKLAARCRSAGIRVPPRLDRAMEVALPDTQFIGTPLATCFKSLAEMSGQLIFINWEKLEDAGIDRRKPITLTLHGRTLSAALQSLVDRASEGAAPLQYRTDANSILVSTREEVDRMSVLTRVYDIRDLLAARGNRPEVIDQLITTITGNFDPDSWRDAGGTVGSLRELQGQLIVTHTERVHARIKAYLDLVRYHGRLTRPRAG